MIITQVVRRHPCIYYTVVNGIRIIFIEFQLFNPVQLRPWDDQSYPWTEIISACQGAFWKISHSFSYPNPQVFCLRHNSFCCCFFPKDLDFSKNLEVGWPQPWPCPMRCPMAVPAAALRGVLRCFQLPRAPLWTHQRHFCQLSPGLEFPVRSGCSEKRNTRNGIIKGKMSSFFRAAKA